MTKTMNIVFRPIEDRVLVSPLPAEEVSAGGIVLPDSAQEKPQRGEVIAVGDGSLSGDGSRVAPGVSTGDIVIYGRYAGNDIKIGGEEHKVLRAGEILAVIEQ